MSCFSRKVYTVIVNRIKKRNARNIPVVGCRLAAGGKYGKTVTIIWMKSLSRRII